MEIVIENEPTTIIPPPPPPAKFHHHSPNFTSAGFYHFATLPRGQKSASTMTIANNDLLLQQGPKRVDKSGLLPASNSDQCLARPRIDRSGLLEAVPELPDQIVNLKELPRTVPGAEVEITINNNNIRRRSSDESIQTKTGHRVQFAPTTIIVEKDSSTFVADVVDEDTKKHHLSNVVPDVIEAHHNGCGGSTSSSSTSDAGGSGEPEGERAEAEGCEQHNKENHHLDERYNKSTTNSSNTAQGKNDNIQAVHVIILSEQLWDRFK